jgi:hypothetical protein
MTNHETHGNHKGVLPHMGTQLHSCHHVWFSIDKTSKEVCMIKVIMAICHAAPLTKCVRFSLPCDHIDCNSLAYCRCCPLLDDKTQLHPMLLAKLQQHTIHNPTLLATTLREGVLNETISSAISNTGATLHALLPSTPSIPTGICSKVV